MPIDGIRPGSQLNAYLNDLNRIVPNSDINDAAKAKSKSAMWSTTISHILRYAFMIVYKLHLLGMYCDIMLLLNYSCSKYFNFIRRNLKCTSKTFYLQSFRPSDVFRYTFFAILISNTIVFPALKKLGGNTRDKLAKSDI